MQYSIKFKSKISRMVISGSKKGKIQSQFHINSILIDDFVNEYRKTKIRELKSIKSDIQICRLLAITKNEFYEYLSIINRQNGRTNYVTQICKKNKAIYQKV